MIGFQNSDCRFQSLKMQGNLPFSLAANGKKINTFRIDDSNFKTMKNSKGSNNLEERNKVPVTVKTLCFKELHLNPLRGYISTKEGAKATIISHR